MFMVYVVGKLRSHFWQGFNRIFFSIFFLFLGPNYSLETKLWFNLRTNITYDTYTWKLVCPFPCLFWGRYYKRYVRDVTWRGISFFTTPKAHVPITFRPFCFVLSGIYPALVNPLDLIPPRCHIPAGSSGALRVTMLNHEDFCVQEQQKAHNWCEKVLFKPQRILKLTKYNKLLFCLFWRHPCRSTNVPYSHTGIWDCFLSQTILTL